MDGASLPSGAAFRRRFLLGTLSSSLGATLLLSLYLTFLLRLPAEQWWGFAVIVSGGGLFQLS